MELNKNSQKKLERILTTAKEQFDQHGYNKTTMNSIIVASHISRGTVYKYFSDKQVLYEALIIDIYSKEIKEFEEIIESNTNFNNKIVEIIKIRMAKYSNTNEKFYEDRYFKSQHLENFITNYTKEIKNLRKTLYTQGKKEAYIDKEITDDTLELYFEIIQEGLLKRFHEIANLSNEKLSNLLILIYSGLLHKKCDSQTPIYLEK